MTQEDTHTANVYKNHRKNNVFFLKLQPIPAIGSVNYIGISFYYLDYPSVQTGLFHRMKHKKTTATDRISVGGGGCMGRGSGLLEELLEASAE